MQESQQRVGQATVSAGETADGFSGRRRILWLAPLAAILLLAVGWWVNSTVQRSLRQRQQGDLQALLRASTEGLSAWFNSQENLVGAAVKDQEVVKAVQDLLAALDSQEPKQTLAQAPAQAELREQFELLVDGTHYDDYGVVAMDGTILAYSDDSILGTRAESIVGKLRMKDLAAAERPTVWPPMKGRDGGVFMAASAPVERDGKTVAMVFLLFDPAVEFGRLLRAARSGDSGETYAFDRTGLMLSDSRFTTQLQSLGLLPPGSEHSAMQVQLRNPGVDLTAGETTEVPMEQRPLTKLVQRAIEGGSGVDVVGYRDYRGAQVLGAWVWMERYAMGVATEVDKREAYALSYQLQRIIGVLFFFLVFATAAFLITSHFTSLLKQRNEKVERRIHKLGQYTLRDKLGEGGMGAVFKATHAMLRRPTAIKLLKESAAGNAQALTRFEREVQITASLTHPNTIAIYDYGKTPDGTFYYAMELLGGTDMDALVIKSGAVSPSRLIHVLLQVCGSLQEAHDAGLIHRDIKPANMILCTRGGVPDTVKVLDFGLVKEQRSEDTKITAVNAVMGTPAFIAPEVVSEASAASPQSDIYSLGATAYFLLTRRYLFEKGDVMQVLIAQMAEEPKPPSAHRPVPEDLERVIMRMLKKDPAERQASMNDVADELLACADAGKWTRKDAEAWWLENGDRVTQRSISPISGLERTFEIDMESRAKKLA